MSPRRALGLLTLLAGLAGCMAPAPRLVGATSDSARAAWAQHRERLRAIDGFTLNARLAETGLSATRADLHWVQAGERYDVDVSGPLGVGALAIHGDDDGAEIRSKDGVVSTTDPEGYMQAQLGWSLPLSRLRYWVLGLPASVRGAPAPSLLIDEQGRALEVRQDGWTIDYEAYGGAAEPVLPRKLSLGDGDRRFRMVIDRWQPADHGSAAR